MTMKEACEMGDINRVKYLHEQHSADITAKNNEAVRWAARNGYLEVVKYINEHGTMKLDDTDWPKIEVSSDSFTNCDDLICTISLEHMERDDVYVQCTSNGHHKIRINYLLSISRFTCPTCNAPIERKQYRII